MSKGGKKPDETQVSFRLPRGIRSQPVFPTVILEFDERTYAYLVEDKGYIIGRAEDADICIPDANLSSTTQSLSAEVTQSGLWI